MTVVGGLATAALAAFLALPVAATGGIFALRPPVATNYRGRSVPLSIGLALAWSYGCVGLLAALHAFVGSDRTLGAEVLWVLLAMAIVYGAGLYDDLRPARVHGLRTHFLELGRGRVTSGIVKLLAALVAAAIATLASGGRGWSLVLAIPLIAGVTNVFNLLDVAPGRALKFGFCVAVGLLVAHSSVLAWASAGQTAALVPFDVREKGMLGDAGSNLLGFVLGYLLWRRLSTVGMAVALGVVLALHALAETVTFTRIIRATPPLRWLDDLGRLPAQDHGTAPAGSG